jgi:hypothetical protein
MLSPASNHEGAVFSNGILEDSNNHGTSDPLDSSMRLSDDEAELAIQRPIDSEASPLLFPARMATGDDLASPDADDIVHIVLQLGSLHSPAK